MVSQTKEKLFEIGEIGLLLTLIFVRAFISSDENAWISLLNYTGLIVAFVSVYLDAHRQCSSFDKFNVATGVFITILTLLVIIAALILTEVIVLSIKWNDIILLLTLLISLPSSLYKTWIFEAVKE